MFLGKRDFLDYLTHVDPIGEYLTSSKSSLKTNIKLIHYNFDNANPVTQTHAANWKLKIKKFLGQEFGFLMVEYDIHV